MKKAIAVFVSTFVLTGALGVGGAWAEGKVIITREENKPKDVEIKAGDEVRFINSSAQTAHVWFAGNAAARFYVPQAVGAPRSSSRSPARMSTRCTSPRARVTRTLAPSL